MKLRPADIVFKVEIIIPQFEDPVMKAAFVICLGMMMLLVTPPLLALDETLTSGRFINATIEQSEKAIRNALDAPSPGLQISGANTARQLKELLPEESFSSLVIPLMRIVKDEKAQTSARIVAAVALHGMKSGRGDFAISRTADYTDNQRVKKVCFWLAYDRKIVEKEAPPINVPKLQSLIEYAAPEPLPELAF